MVIRRLLVGVVLAVVATVLLPAAVGQAAPAYPPSVGGLEVSASSVVTGGSVQVAGSGFKPGSQVIVTVRVGGVVVATFPTAVDALGEIFTTLHLTHAGETTIIVTGVDPDGAARVLTSVVEAASAGSAGAELPNTGANIRAPLVLGGALLLGGAGAVLVTRRRRRRGTADAS
jgi:LPXTG-motif cell wall-anchored protein